MTDDLTQHGRDLRLVKLAALAFLHWRDTGDRPDLMGDAIDADELAAALDRLEGLWPVSHHAMVRRNPQVDPNARVLAFLNTLM